MSDDIIKRLREEIRFGCVPGSFPVEIVRPGYIAAASPDNIAALLDRLDAAERENERLREDAERLNALIMLVARKYPGESRYETAYRYISQAENQEVSGPKIDAAIRALGADK